jgi:hypothetical protein
MNNIFYAAAYDWEDESGEQVVCFDSQDARDRFVDNEIGAYYIDEDYADELCILKHDCTAREAHQKGLI